jgi:hypothetical protein
MSLLHAVTSNPASKRHAVRAHRWLAFCLPLLLTLALFAPVALQSQGFDDEMANMELIEHLGTWPTVALMQTEDVHPPGGYLLNGLLFDALHDWSLVRGVSALLYALSVAWLVQATFVRQGPRAAGLALLFALLSPAALMWCTSLRWYAYFVPLWIWALVTPERPDGLWYASKPALAWWLMACINYAALILAPVLMLWYGLHAGMPLRTLVRRSLWPWLLATLAYAPQFYVFLTVHSQHAEGQAGGLLKALVGCVIGLASNQGLFPLSGWGIASILASCALLAMLLRQARHQTTWRSILWPLGAAIGAFVVTGLAGKFRNLVLISPMQAMLMGRASTFVIRKKWAMACTAVLLLANAAGCLHVAQHRDTAKNGWNLPVADVVAGVHTMRTGCTGQTAVYTFDPVLARALRLSDARIMVGNYFARFDKVQPAATDCAIVIMTYKGALPAERFDALRQAMQHVGGTQARKLQIQRDEQAALKRKLDPDFPDYVVELQLFQGQLDLSALNAWASSRR